MANKTITINDISECDEFHLSDITGRKFGRMVVSSIGEHPSTDEQNPWIDSRFYADLEFEEVSGLFHEFQRLVADGVIGVPLDLVQEKIDSLGLKAVDDNNRSTSIFDVQLVTFLTFKLEPR